MVFSLRDGHVAKSVSPAPATVGAEGKYEPKLSVCRYLSLIMRCNIRTANAKGPTHGRGAEMKRGKSARGAGGAEVNAELRHVSCLRQNPPITGPVETERPEPAPNQFRISI